MNVVDFETVLEALDSDHGTGTGIDGSARGKVSTLLRLILFVL